MAKHSTSKKARRVEARRVQEEQKARKKMARLGVTNTPTKSKKTSKTKPK